jgi:hypothetical protein
MEPIEITIQIDTLPDKEAARDFDDNLYGYLNAILTAAGIKPIEWTKRLVYQNEVRDAEE